MEIKTYLDQQSTRTEILQHRDFENLLKVEMFIRSYFNFLYDFV